MTQTMTLSFVAFPLTTCSLDVLVYEVEINLMGESSPIPFSGVGLTPKRSPLIGVGIGRELRGLVGVCILSLFVEPG